MRAVVAALQPRIDATTDSGTPPSSIRVTHVCRLCRARHKRHSYATILLAAGEHPKVVQELLGHSSVQLTLDTYSHLLPDLLLKERAAARLDAILVPKPEAARENSGQNSGQTETNVVSLVGIESDP